MVHVGRVQARTQGLAGLQVSPDMAATAASQMANMTPEQLENMAMMADLGQQQQQSQPSAAASSFSRPAAAAAPSQAPIMPSAASDPMQAASTLMQVCTEGLVTKAGREPSEYGCCTAEPCNDGGSDEHDAQRPTGATAEHDGQLQCCGVRAKLAAAVLNLLLPAGCDLQVLCCRGAAGGDRDAQMAQAQAMMRDPQMMKAAQQMMADMPPEALKAMSSAAGLNLSDQQVLCRDSRHTSRAEQHASVQMLPAVLSRIYCRKQNLFR